MLIIGVLLYDTSNKVFVKAKPRRKLHNTGKRRIFNRFGLYFSTWPSIFCQSKITWNKHFNNHIIFEFAGGIEEITLERCERQKKKKIKTQSMKTQ
jgi:hypothetical protein